MTDVHNLYNEWKNKTLYLIDNISNHYCKKKLQPNILVKIGLIMI